MSRLKCAIALIVVALSACQRTRVDFDRRVSPELLAAEKRMAGTRILAQPGQYILSTNEHYRECLSYIKGRLVQRCELAGSASAVIRTQPGLAARYPSFADQFVEDYGAIVPIGPQGPPLTGSPNSPSGSGSCSTVFQPRQASGPVITKARIQNLYWGSYWNTSPGFDEMVAQDATWS